MTRVCIDWDLVTSIENFSNLLVIKQVIYFIGSFTAKQIFTIFFIFKPPPKEIQILLTT